jgi:hypothetical protein
MPTIDEDTLRDLMHRSTSDLHASPAVTAGIVATHRRRRTRNRVLSLTAAGVAAGTAFGLVAAGTVGGAAAAPAASRGAHHTRLPAIRLTAAQRTLYHLSSVAAKATQPPGRYVVLTETQADDSSSYQRTSVIDSQTGDTWTYQKGAGVPGTLPVDRGGTTQAQFATWPTDPVALRALLLKQAKQQYAAGIAAERAQLKKLPKSLQGKKRAILQSGPPVSADSFVFEQATITLWNPLPSPALRSALFKVLASTPGMTVNSHATDSLGRPSVQISRTDNAEGEVTSVFEDPAGAGVHEMLFTYPAQGSQPGSQSSDVFLSTTRTDTFPPNPYGNG